VEGNVPVDLLVNAVLDGRPVDWDSAESSASSDDQRAEIHHLRTLAAIAALSRGSDATQTEMPPAKVDLWGPLRLLERVGEGSFGEVFRAWDTKLAREVALKLIRHREPTTDWSEDRALEEGRLLARIRHPNVVTVFGADRIGDRVGIWMEFIQGRTLQQILRAQGALSAREAAAIGLDLCLALSAVHRAGLLHRDLKAQNVMREDGGRVVLMDFGAGRENRQHEPSAFAGTPLYLAPEVFAGGAATVRSDLYSLGVLLYHLVTSSYPVRGSTTEEIRAAHGERRRMWLRDERPDLPDKFVRVIERALEFDPDERYESAGAMEAALARLASASDSGILAAETSSSIAVQTPARRSFSRAKWIAAAALAAGVVAAVSSGPIRSLVAGWRGGSPPGRSAGGAGLGSSEAVRKVTLPEGNFVQPSPDGRFFSLSDSAGNVAVLELATGRIRRLTNEAVRGTGGGAIGGQYGQYAESSAMSADSQFVAYAWYALDGKYELRVVDIDGRRPRVLLRSEAIDYLVPLQWSRDGKFILSTLTRPDLSVQLALVSSDDGVVRPIKELGGVSPHYASLSPDGQFVVYDAPQQRSAAARDVFIVRSDGTDDRHLIDHPANDRIPVWTPDGRRVLFASDRSGTTDVWAVEVAGGLPQGEPQMIHRNIGRMWLRGLTDTGSYFYEATIGTVDVYEASLAGGVASNPKTVPTSYSGSNLGSVWSPDGQRLAFVSRRGLPFDRSSATLVIRDRQTQEQRELVLAMNSFLPRTWLPDGRHILTTGVDPRDRWGNYQIDVDTGRTTPIVLSDRPSHDTDIGPGYGMPDGRILYFNGAKHALLARSVRTGAEEVLFDFRAEGIRLRGGSYRVSPDGQTLALTALIQQGETLTSAVIVKVPGAGPLRELVRAQPSETVLFQDWTPDGQAVLFTRWTRTSEPSTLWRVSIYGGDPQPLNLSIVGLRDVSVNPDGTKITFTAGWPMKEVWVMENFLPR
jgi:serine/threonine protein kinase/Tol biopolymer transport system component